nr:hypothetical protein [Tanacetum cinerariifolium]
MSTLLLSKVISRGEARFLVFLSSYLQHCMRTRNSLVWGILVKEYQKKDKIRSKPDKNGKRGEAGKSQKQLQWKEEEKLNKTQKRPKTETKSKSIQALKE